MHKITKCQTKIKKPKLSEEHLGFFTEEAAFKGTFPEFLKRISRRSKPVSFAYKKSTVISSKSRWIMAEKEGFEPSIPFWGIHDFQSCALGQLRDFSISCGSLSSPDIIPHFRSFVKKFFRLFQRYFFGGRSGGKGPPGRGLRPWSRARWAPSRKAPASSNLWGPARGWPDSTRRPAD